MKWTIHAFEILASKDTWYMLKRLVWGGRKTINYMIGEKICVSKAYSKLTSLFTTEVLNLLQLFGRQKLERKGEKNGKSQSSLFKGNN